MFGITRRWLRTPSPEPTVGPPGWQDPGQDRPGEIPQCSPVPVLQMLSLSCVAAIAQASRARGDNLGGLGEASGRVWVCVGGGSVWRWVVGAAGGTGALWRYHCARGRGVGVPMSRSSWRPRASRRGW